MSPNCHPATHGLSLDELLTYARCPLEWYWEKQVGAGKPYTADELVPAAVRQAIAYYYAGHAESVGAGVGLVWHDWCEGWGNVGLADELARYQEGRARILIEFEKGHITRPDGSQYVAPQMTHEYRSRMHRAGLSKVGRRLDEFAASHSIVLGLGGDPGETSALGDAYADCVLIAAHLQGKGSRALPAREVVLGAQAAYQVRLGAFCLTGQADLVVEDGREPQASDRPVALEVHDYRATKLTAGAAARDLRVISASLSQSAEGASVVWEAVDHVVYRHMRSGQTFAIKHTDPGRLLAVVAAVARGIRSGVVVPRALSNPFDCRACAYHPRCFAEEGWDTVDLVDPTASAQAERLTGILQRVKASISGDGRVAEQTRRALAAVEQGIRDELPDLAAALEALLEAGAAMPDPGQ